MVHTKASSEIIEIFFIPWLWLMVLPESLQAGILQKAHAGHPGMVHMKRKLPDTCWWARLDTQVGTVVRACTGCQMSGKSHPPDLNLPISVSKPSIPWKCLGLDISGPFAIMPQNKQFIILIVDNHSRYPQVLLLMDIWSSAITHWLKELSLAKGAR